ncbi:MAG: PAS domain S-box protein [Acidobacteriia bacterium]|nr:PAS domain S-box protein [Terriglobia bacterium]
MSYTVEPTSEAHTTPLSSAFGENLPTLEYFGRLFDVTHDLVAVLGFDGHFKFVNSSWESTLGYSREELTAMPYVELIHPDDRAATLEDAQKVMAGTRTTSFENRQRCRDGSYRWFSWSVTVSNPEQVFYAAARDVTDQKRTEERVLRVAHAMENNSEMICMAGADGRAVFVNRALLQATGYREEELLGRSLNESLLSPNNPATLTEEFQDSFRREGKWRGECLYRRKDGTNMPVSLSLSVLRNDEGLVTGAFAIVQDITERRRLEESVVRLAHAVENNREMICMTDETGRASFVNPALLQATGFREEDLLGKDFAETLFSPNNPPTLQEEIQNGITREGKWRGEALQRRKKGPDLPVSLSISVIRDNGGRVTGAFAVAQDITERRSLEDQLRRAQKMEAVGQLAGGIAHDFNNLLMVIIGYAGDVAERLDASDPLHKKVEQISKAGQRAASLTRQLLAFSRQQVLEPKVLNLNSVVEDIKKMLGRLISEDIELIAELDPDLGQVKTDQGQIEQVIVNLAVNARDAMPQGGKLLIQTSNVEVDDAFARQRPPMSAGPYVRLAITDTGIGMDAETQSHIFEPFFTTKERGKGTGLGLATVYGVVKQSGGFIWVYSEPGKGSTFEVLLPRVKAKPTEAGRQDGGSHESARGSETILLVEDDEALRKLIRLSLGERGYTILEAANGTEALQHARQKAGKIDLLLTDVVMPEMSGPQVADGVVALNPRTKVLYMSGYPEYAAKSEELLKEGRKFLQKPYTTSDLARMVRKTLDAESVPELVTH